MNTSLVSTIENVSLADLAVLANAEARAAVETSTEAIEHAIRAGDALLEARGRVPFGEWEQWLEDNVTEMSTAWARVYMRFARHAALVRQEQPTSIRQARMLIAGPARDSRNDPVIQAEAKRLHATGMTLKAIAEELDVSEMKVWRWCNPKAARKLAAKQRRRSMAGRRALQRGERDKIVKAQGGPVAEAYALVRRALQALETAATQEREADVKKAIRSAMGRLHNAEDEIVRAVKRA